MMIPAMASGGITLEAQAGQGLIKKMLGLGSVGAIEAGAFGAGEAESGERLQGFTDAAAFGGSIGAVIPAGGKVVSMVADTPLAKYLSETRLSRLLNKSLKAENLTIEGLKNRRKMLGNEAVLSDVSDGATQAAQGVVNRNPETKAIAQNALTQRADNVVQRVTESVERIIPTTGRATSSIDNIATLRAAEAAPLYKELETVVPQITPKLQKRLKDTDIIKDAYGEAQRIYNIETGGRLPALFDEVGNVNPQLTMREYASIDQGISALLEKNKFHNLQTGRLTAEGFALNKLKKELVGELDRVAPQYKDARAAWSGGTRQIDAIDQGRKALNGKVDDVLDSTSQMGELERDGFLTGFVDDIRERLARGLDNGIGRLSIIRQAGLKEKLQHVLKPDEIDDLVRSIEREVTFSTTAKNLVGGSQTASRGAAQEAIDATSSLLGAASGSPQAALGAASSLMKRLGNIPDKEAARLTKMLTTPDGFDEALRDLADQGVSPEKRIEILKLLYGGGIATGTQESR